MKLYEVQIHVCAYVLAESERDAEGFAREILDTEPIDDDVTARPVPRNATLAWPGGCLVYGAKKDTTLAEAVAKYVEA